MNLIFSFISNVEYVGLIITIISLISQISLKLNKTKVLWTIGVIFVYTFASVYMKDANLQMLIYVVTIIVIYKIILVGNPINILFSTVIAMVLISIMTQLLKVTTITLLSIFSFSIAEMVVKVVTQTVLWMAIGLLYWYILKNYASEMQKIPLRYIFIFMIVLTAECFSITFLGEFVLKALDYERAWIAELAYVLMGLGVFVQLGLLIALYFSRNAYRTQQALATKYLEEQVAHYQYLSEREQNTKRFRHDFKSHMAMAKQLYEEGKREEFEAYFHKMTEQIAAIGNRVTVNNDIADAIINRYYDEAALAGITMEVEGHFPGECYVSAYDLCTVLSNLLSNAIDAEKEAGGKTIYCGVRYDETQILIVVKNDYVNPIKRTDNRFVSTKGDLRHQGFGIANINEVVRKNNGHIFYDTADARFVVRLSLCNMKQNS